MFDNEPTLWGTCIKVKTFGSMLWKIYSLTEPGRGVGQREELLVNQPHSFNRVGLGILIDMPKPSI